MATLSQAKILGGIGSILIFIPFVSLVGYVLLIVAINDIADYAGDRAIFNNVVIAAVTGIIGALAGAAVISLGVIGSRFSYGVAGLAGLGVGLFIAWVALIVSSVFLKRAYDDIALKLGVGTFKTAATLYLIGSVLTIILLGFIVLFVAEIVQAVAFFSIPEELQRVGAPGSPSTASLAASPPPTPGTANKFCASCGAKISPTATFCYACGAKQT
jgi:uncharacterized membrane protein